MGQKENVSLIIFKYKMKGYKMLNKKIIALIISIIIIFCITCNNVWAIEAITVPETDINLKIENLTRGSKVYILIPNELLKYNMEKFISNNRNNPYEIEAKEAEELQKFLDKEDYVGYVNYFKEVGFNQKVENRFELRHYCFAMGGEEIEVVGEYEYNDSKYVQVSINLDNENQFKLVMKDYLATYDVSNIKFMIDEYGTITYINVSDYSLNTNPEKSNIKESNIVYSYYENEEYESIENATAITYMIIYLILATILLIILIKLLQKHKEKKQEIEDRKFWKKKFTKEEIKAEKQKLREQKKLDKLNKRKR